MRDQSCLLIGILLLLMVSGACSTPQPTQVLIELPANGATPTSVDQADPPSGIETYSNSKFNLSFQFPSNWYGPDVVEGDQGTTISVGSDIVYPYGTSREERLYKINNSYYVTIQFTKSSPNQPDSPYLSMLNSMLNLEDNESFSTPRSLHTRVRSVQLEGFEGIEYISTLSETAQTEFFYVREVVLYDEHRNVLRITGSPNNVERTMQESMLDAYKAVDEENLETFYMVLESITVE